MMKLNKNLQLMLVLALCVGAFSLYRNIIFGPLSDRLEDLKREKQQIELDMPDALSTQKEVERLQKLYEERHTVYTATEEEIEELDQNLPARNDMSSLLENLTKSLDSRNMQFVAIEPTFQDAEEGKIFDSIEIEMQFHADFKVTIEYFKRLEDQSMLLGIRQTEIEMDPDGELKPLVTVQSRTLVSDKFRKETVKKVAPQAENKEVGDSAAKAADPFAKGSRPYDQTLPGNHSLTMVVWNGGTPVALIDGKVMKEGALLDNRQLIKIERDGVWFAENDIHYYLRLES